jgi:hypothetical protein
MPPTTRHWLCLGPSPAVTEKWPPRGLHSRRKVMESLLMGTGHKPLQSVNYHDSRALGYEQSGVLTRLVRFEMVWIGYV